MYTFIFILSDFNFNLGNIKHLFNENKNIYYY